jgi:hypothetical protein
LIVRANREVAAGVYLMEVQLGAAAELATAVRLVVTVVD